MKSLSIIKSVLLLLSFNSIAFAFLEIKHKEVSFLGQSLVVKGNIVDGYSLSSPFKQSFVGADLSVLLLDYIDSRPRGFYLQTKFGPLLADGSFRAIGYIRINGISGEIIPERIYSFRDYPHLLYVSTSKDTTNPKLVYDGKKVSHFIVNVHSSEIYDLTVLKDTRVDRLYAESNLKTYNDVKKEKFTFVKHKTFFDKN